MRRWREGRRDRRGQVVSDEATRKKEINGVDNG